MSSIPLMKRRSLITRRRLIITLILATIFVVSVATGFSKSAPVDNSVYTAENGERVVMWKELPESGTPEDFDLITNLQYTAQKIYTASYFRGETTGSVVANVGMGIKYTQNVHNTRVVKGNTIFSEAISSSSLKSVAEQKYYYGDTILLRKATSVDGDTATFADSVGKFERDAYFAAYGVIPNELTKQCINPDTILSVSDDNVLTKSPANSDGSADDEGEVDYAFDVPATLVADENGIYRFTLVLDPDGATKYSRNEVRTLAAADQNPTFHSVKVSVEIDSEWNPISVTAVENYNIAIPVLGQMNLTSSLTEVFSDINDNNGVIPEQEFFEAHIDTAGDADLTASTSPSDYLAAAFAEYLDGSKNLDLAANISINDFNINGLALSVNIGTPLSVKAKLDQLAIEYSNDRVYITLNDIKGYVSTDKFGALLSDPTLSATLSSLLGDNELGGLLDGGFSLDGLFASDDILSTVFADCEMTEADGVVKIRLPFSLDGINIDASLYINDGDKSLSKIEGTVNAFGLNVKIDARPQSAVFPTVDNTYADLSPALDFIPDALGFVTSETYGVSGTVNAFGTDVTVDELYIDRTDKDNILLDGKLKVGDVDISAKLTDGIIYLEVGDIRIKTAVEDIGPLVSTISELVGADAPSFDITDIKGMLAELMPEKIDISEMLSAIEYIGATDKTLSARVNALGAIINLSLERGDGSLKKVGLSINGEINSTKLDISADLSLTNPTPREVTVSGEYITPDDLLQYASPIINLVNDISTAKTVRLALSAAINTGDRDLLVTSDDITISIEDDISVSGTLTIGGEIAVEVTYVGGSVYLRLGNVGDDFGIAISLDTAADIAKLTDILSEYTSDGADLGKLLSPSDDDTIKKLKLIINKFKAMEGGDVQAILDGLFGALDKDYAHSAAYYLLDMIGLSVTGGEATVTAGAFGFELAVTPTISSDKEKLVGAVASVSSKTTTEGGVTTVNTIGTLRASLVEISEETTVISVPDDDYLQAVDYIQPILNLVNDISAAKTVKLDLSAAITLSESVITVTCDDITISIEDSVSVSATLDIGNDVAIEVVYKNDVIYLRLANLVDGVVDSDHNIAVSLDMTTDLIRLNDVLSQYLPEYLSDELSKILAPSDGDEDDPSAFDKLGLIINGFKSMANAPTVDSILNGLFAPLSAIYDHSAVYYMLDMVSLKGIDGEAVVSANILGLTLNLTPTLSEDRTELLGATASISSDKGQVGAIDVSFSEISEASTIIAVPSDEYVPLIEYVELINNLINTFTTATGESVDDVLGGSKPNEDKTYTFEIPELTSPIVYREKALDENGNVLRNPDGTAQVSNTITISSTGQSLLRGKIAVPAKDSAVDSHGIADTKAKIEIEAHVKLSISKLKDTYGDITLDLYIINGEAYLKYVEGKSGYGETVSIDYDSVMQILASVMNIVGVDSEIVNSVFGSYNQDIDTSMFKSLKIAGFDGIQKTASELAAAVESIKTALGELKTAWSIVKNCLSIDELGTKLDELSFHFDAAMDAVKSISFGETKPADTDLFKKIIGGIKLGVTEAIDGEKTVYADVDNSITVDEAFEFGASPTARVSVTETTDREKNIIKGIRIENLDVKTALLDGGITFKAGDEVDDFTVTLPDGLLDRGNEKHTYSDLSNIKYLLYDIMNTANLMEFDISGVNTSDVINVKMKLIGLDMINFDIHYNVKVKIFTKDELKAIGLPVKESDPEIKTMAYVELYYKNCKFATSSLIPDCTTKLYFFDDMLYVDGVRMYLETTTGLFGIKTTTQKSERVLCKYTTEQFGYMVSNDIGKFLEEFLFYLVPLTKRVSSILTVDIQQIIIDNVTKESKTDLSNKTIAKVFKGYSYNVETGKHDLTIGLKELAGNSALGDLNVSFTGANDGDNNLLDNYLQSAYIGTNIGVTGVAVELKLNATLRNVGVVSDGGVDKIRSTWTDGNERAFLNNCITQIIPNTAWVDIWAGVA